MEKKRCRHERNSWALAGADYAILWCYKCGAIREMKRNHEKNSLVPLNGWVLPVGQDGKNPALKG